MGWGGGREGRYREEEGGEGKLRGEEDTREEEERERVGRGRE